MSDNHVPYLCGSTFFFLLLQARWQKSSARQRRSGVKDGLNDCYVMDGLVYVMTGNRNYNPLSSLKKETSKFRECGLNGSENIPFTNFSAVSAFENAVKNKYSTILKRMAEFVTDYIDSNKYELLVRYLLEVIDQDTIPESTEFYVSDGNNPVSKDKLRTMTQFQIEPFLIGIFLYILKNRTVNTPGLDTLDVWAPKTEGKERKLQKTDLGNSVTRSLMVDRANIEERYSIETETGPMTEPISEPQTDTPSEDSETQPEPQSEKPSFQEVFTERLMKSAKAMADAFGRCEDAMRDQLLEQEEKEKTENAEAEVVDEEVLSGAAPEKTDGNVTMIKQQTNVVQNGDHNVNLTNNGTINFNF